MPTALPLQQHPSFADALRAVGTHVQTVNLPGAAPIIALRRFRFFFASRGPVWNADATPDAHALRASPLRVFNAECAGPIYRAAGFRQIMTPASVAELSLTGSATDRLARARPKWRHCLKPHRFHIQHQHFDHQRHQWLLEADSAQQRGKGFRALPHALTCAFAAMHRKSTHLWTAQQGGQPIAAMLFLAHPPVATYHIGWSAQEGRRSNAHHHLLMAAADHFADAGLQRLDLGTVDTENAPGLARFKIGAGATVRPLGGTWLRIPGL